MKEDDKILKYLKIEDLSESIDVFTDYMTGIEWEELKDEEFYQGDGLDAIRWWIKNFGGLAVRMPQVRSLTLTTKRYIKQRKLEKPDIHINRLAQETGLEVRTIKGYLDEK